MFLIHESVWELRKTPDRGRGIFAVRSIPGGTVLGDYLGRLLLPDDITKREEKLGSLYGMYRDEVYTIWPNVKVAGVHLVNHSCMPNTQFTPYRGHMLLVATRKIFPGEELTAAYNVTTPDKGDEALPCLCDTLLCNGTMTSSAAKLDKIFDETITSEYYAYQVKEGLKCGDSIPVLSSYPKVMADNPLYSLFAVQGKLPITKEDSRLPKRNVLRELIRTSGRPIYFLRLGVIVYGVIQDRVLINI